MQGISYSGDQLEAGLVCSCREEELEVQTFYFFSEFLSFGPLGYSGMSSGLVNSSIDLFRFDREEGMIPDRQGNPENNMGVVFNFPGHHSGLAYNRRESSSSALIWFTPDYLTAGELVLAQSFSFDEEDEEDDSWYLDEPPHYSSFDAHTLVSLILGDEDLYGGSRLIVNSAPSDRGGLSLLLMAGGSGDRFAGQTDLLWITPYFVTVEQKKGE
jgi:hypothetical protein